MPTSLSIKIPNAIKTPNPTSGGQEMDVYSMLGNYMANQMQGSSNETDIAQVAEYLGNAGNTGNSALGVDPSDLWGMGVEQVSNLAKDRSAINYQKMMANLGALEFQQKIAGIPEQRQLQNKMIEGEQIRKTQEELANIHGAWAVRAASAGVTNPVSAKQLSIIDRISKEDKTVTQVERDLALKLIDSGSLKPETATEILKYTSMGTPKRDSSGKITNQEAVDMFGWAAPYAGLAKLSLERASKSGYATGPDGGKQTFDVKLRSGRTANLEVSPDGTTRENGKVVGVVENGVFNPISNYK